MSNLSPAELYSSDLLAFLDRGEDVHKSGLKTRSIATTDMLQVGQQITRLDS